MAAEDRTTTVRFAGLGNATDGQWVYQCGPDNTAAGSNNEDYLAEHPKVSPASVGILDAIGKGGGVTLEFVYKDSEEPVQAIARTAVTFARDSNNAVGRVAEFTDATETTIPTDVDLSGTLSVNDYVWFGSEAAVVTAVTSSNFTVATRGAVGTTASDLPRQSLGMVIMTAAPPIAGRAVTVKESVTSDASETTIFNGIVTDVRPAAGGNPARLTVSAQSRIRDLFGNDGRTWYVPRSSNTFQVRNSRFARLATDRRIAFVNDRVFGSMQSSYLRLFSEDGHWAVVAVTLDEETPSVDYYKVAAGQNVVQMGIDDLVYPTGRWDEVFERGQGVTGCMAEWVAVYTSAVTPYDLLVDLLIGDSTWPWGASLGLSQSADVDIAQVRSVFRRALPFNLRSRHVGPQYAATVQFVLPWFQPDEKIGDIIKKEVVAPAFCALAPAKDGRLTAFDWRDVLVSADTVTQTDIMDGPPGEAAQSLKTVVREMQLSASLSSGGGEGTLTDRVISEYASAIHATGRSLKHKVRVLASALTQPGDTEFGPLHHRMRGLIATYERAARTGALVLSSTNTTDIGDVLRVTCDDLPGPDGVRGSTSERFLVSERGREASGKVLLRGVYLGTDEGAEWAPVAEVSSYSSGTITVKDDGRFTASDDSTSPAAYFEVGDYVILLDQYGTEKVGTATEITGISGDDISDMTAFATAVDGDLIVLADYDETGQDNTWAWQADDAAELGAAGDDAKVWT